LNGVLYMLRVDRE